VKAGSGFTVSTVGNPVGTGAAHRAANATRWDSKTLRTIREAGTDPRDIHDTAERPLVWKITLKKIFNK